jgi:hypothetical protein
MVFIPDPEIELRILKLIKVDGETLNGSFLNFHEKYGAQLYLSQGQTAQYLQYLSNVIKIIDKTFHPNEKFDKHFESTKKNIFKIKVKKRIKIAVYYIIPILNLIIAIIAILYSTRQSETFDKTILDSYQKKEDVQNIYVTNQQLQNKLDSTQQVLTELMDVKIDSSINEIQIQADITKTK